MAMGSLGSNGTWRNAEVKLEKYHLAGCSVLPT